MNEASVAQLLASAHTAELAVRGREPWPPGPQASRRGNRARGRRPPRAGDLPRGGTRPAIGAATPAPPGRVMTDSLTLDYLRAIDASAARIAASLEALVKIADELATARETHREEAPGVDAISAREGRQ